MKKHDFVDTVSFSVASGKGGAGAVSYRREAKVPRGGPDGGDGGKGGDVILKVNPQLHTLYDFKARKFYNAGNGVAGQSRHKSGSNGDDLILELPLGSMIFDKFTGELICDLNQEDSSVVLLSGGRGGKGNSFFKTSVNQTPDYSQPGEEGAELELEIQLRLIAQIGLLGLPNAGKSTFLSVISSAKPKIANYPFTTLIPQLGVVKKFGQELIVADIPGVIEGAHKGIGLGNDFLRHIERTKCFVHLVDGDPNFADQVIHDVKMIREELLKYEEKADETFKSQLGFEPVNKRSSYLVLTKADLMPYEHQQRMIHQLKEAFPESKVFLISSITQQGVQEILTQLFNDFYTTEEEL